MLPMNTRLRNPRRSLVSSPISVPVRSYQQWSPLALQPRLWLDAADASTITSSSGKVSQWSDKSGFGRHAVQGASASQPSTGVDTQNGLNVITFSKSPLWWMSASPGYNVQATGLTFFFVAKNTVSDAAAIQGFGQEDGTGVGRFWIQGLASQLAAQSLVGGNVSSQVAVSYFNDVVLFRVHMPAGTNQTRVFAVDNGAASASATAGTDNATGAFVVGSNKIRGNGWPGWIAEIILYGYLTESQINAVESYLNAKWAVY